MSSFCRAVFFTLLLLLPPVISAQAEEALREDEVRRFLVTLEELEVLGERYPDGTFEDIEIDPEAGFSPIGASLAEFRDHESYPELQAILRASGFDDEDRWAEIGDRTLRAYMALQIEEENPHMLAELREALLELEKRPALNDEQRAMVMAMMGPAIAIARSIDAVPEADLRTIRALRPDIDAVMQP